MEIELNFRFDANGRTASTSQKSNGSTKEDENDVSIDYSSRAVMTTICDLSTSTLDDLLFDCEISDSGLMPRTFWVPVEGMKPRCSLEQFALDVFHHHVPNEPPPADPRAAARIWGETTVGDSGNRTPRVSKGFFEVERPLV